MSHDENQLCDRFSSKTLEPLILLGFRRVTRVTYFFWTLWQNARFSYLYGENIRFSPSDTLFTGKGRRSLSDHYETLKWPPPIFFQKCGLGPIASKTHRFWRASRGFVTYFPKRVTKYVTRAKTPNPLHHNDFGLFPNFGVTYFKNPCDKFFALLFSKN